MCKWTVFSLLTVAKIKVLAQSVIEHLRESKNANTAALGSSIPNAADSDHATRYPPQTCNEYSQKAPITIQIESVQFLQA